MGKRWGIHAGAARVVVGLAWLVLGASFSGCADPLLSPDEPRSQFDRYDRLRSQYAAQYTSDEFGRRVANLRARLMPKE